jgi:hypothetical protein
MVEIAWISGTSESEGNEHPETACCPEVLICSVSSVVKRLCEESPNRKFTIDQILDGMTQLQFQSFGEVPEFDLSLVLDVFTTWIYTGKWKSDVFARSSEIWYFAIRIGAPRLQNALLRDMCKGSFNNDDEDYILNSTNGQLLSWNIREPSMSGDAGNWLSLLDCFKATGTYKTV